MAELAAAEPEDPRALGILGKMRLDRGQRAAAIDDFTRALALAPDDVIILAHRARAYGEEGDHERALADLDRALAARPDDPELHLARSRVLGALGRLEDALAGASRAVSLAPDHALGHLLRAVYRAHLEGDEAFEQVKADLDRAVELAPERASFHRERGEYLMGLGKVREALADFDAALARAPDVPELYYGRCYCKSRIPEELGDLDPDYDEDEEDTKTRCASAIADFERAIALGMCTQDLYMELWNTHCQLNDDAAQRAALDRACEAVPDGAMLHYFRYGQRRSRGDVEGAAADRARAIALGFKVRDED
jgi:tetratricopeptide (TPR) repeat protein